MELVGGGGAGGYLVSNAFVTSKTSEVMSTSVGRTSLPAVDRAATLVCK